MKKVLLSITAFALVAGSMTFTSCKKGENDPAISFKSRKGRLAGEWTVSSAEMSGTDSNTSGGTTTSSTWSRNYDGATLTEVQTSGNPSTTQTTTNSVSDWSYTFEKDGTWSSSMAWTTTQIAYSSSAGSSSVAVTTCNSFSDMASGNWSFVGKDKDGEYKGKERVVLNTTSSTSTQPAWNCTGSEKDSYTSSYANGENSEIWDIDQLKSKETIVMMEGNSTWTSSPNGGGGSSSTSTFTGTITLTAK